MTTTAPFEHRPSRSIALPRSRHAPAVARRVAFRWFAAGRGTADRASDAVLVVSELVTNTLRHTSGPCLLTLTDDGAVVDVAVTDTSAEPPHLEDPDRAGEHGGFGMAMLAELGARVTVEPVPHGKTVHAVLDLGPDAAPARAVTSLHHRNPVTGARRPAPVPSRRTRPAPGTGPASPGGHAPPP
ncbi:ATP-binding protein [Streptomyces sp. NPDC085946]|uniref:ATP-binding protein n=1 Tax=Streptomyces sp. NPDC085946 TaxID=3365744 RepID=UPI0037CD5B2B